MNNLLKFNSFYFRPSKENKLIYSSQNKNIPTFDELVKSTIIEIPFESKNYHDYLHKEVEYTDYDTHMIMYGKIIKIHENITANGFSYSFDVKFNDKHILKKVRIKSNEQYRIFIEKPLKYINFWTEIITTLTINEEFFNYKDMITRGNQYHKVKNFCY